MRKAPAEMRTFRAGARLSCVIYGRQSFCSLLLFFFGSLVALPFKRLRPKAKWIAPASVVAFVLSFVLFGLARDREGGQETKPSKWASRTKRTSSPPIKPELRTVTSGVLKKLHGLKIYGGLRKH